MDASRQMQTTITSILNHVGECKKKKYLPHPFLHSTTSNPYMYIRLLQHSHTRAHPHTHTPPIHTHTHTHKTKMQPTPKNLHYSFRAEF